MSAGAHCAARHRRGLAAPMRGRRRRTAAQPQSPRPLGLAHAEPGWRDLGPLRTVCAIHLLSATTRRQHSNMAEDGEGSTGYTWTSLEPLPEGQEEPVTAKFV